MAAARLTQAAADAVMALEKCRGTGTTWNSSDSILGTAHDSAVREALAA